MKKKKTKTFFQKYWTFKILIRREQQRYDITICPQKCQFFRRDQDGRYQAFCSGEFRVSKSRWIKLNTIVWIIVRSVIQCRVQNRQFFHRECLYNWKFHLWDFDRGNDVSSNSGWVWMSGKVITGSCFWFFRLSGLYYNERKQRFLTTIVLYKWFVFERVPDEKNRLCSFRK